MNIKLNISGQHFEINKNILTKIPYFHDMLDACNEYDLNEIIFINRSPHIFKHVLGSTIDQLYPFPLKYAFELDFYGIQYHEVNLQDKYSQLENKIKYLEEQLNNILFKNIVQYCIFDYCTELCAKNSLHCYSHMRCMFGECIIDPCENCNYCAMHESVGQLCSVGGCANDKYDKYYCKEHKD